jgi:DNA-binding transcriptional ArsR family regulator
MHSAALDRTFHALADGTRRTIVHTLARTPNRTAGELGRRFRSAQPTISKHLKVLEGARLIERVVQGRTHRFRLRRATLSEAARWIARHERFWQQAVGRLDALLAEEGEP